MQPFSQGLFNIVDRLLGLSQQQQMETLGTKFDSYVSEDFSRGH